MLRFGAALTVLCLSSLPSLAQADGDPTFNGLLARATCYIRNITACRAGSCVQIARACQGDLCGTFDLLLKSRQYTFPYDKQPLDITEISPAVVGKPLWIKFKLPLKGTVGDGQLTLQPRTQGGGYVATTSVIAPIPGNPGVQAFTLINFDCDQQSDGP